MSSLMPIRLDYAIEKKMALLQVLYEVFKEEAQKFKFVCKPGCVDCCTVNLLATSAEVNFLLNNLSHDQRKVLEEKVKPLKGRARLRPKITPNEMAFLCLAGKQPPEDEGYVREACPFLGIDRLCTIYKFRPFTCRSFFSLIPCYQTGEAIIPPEFLSLITTFMQLLEEIDLAGIYGNFFDILLYFIELDSNKELPVPDDLLSNRQAPDFAIPPEHEGYVRKILAKLYRKPIRERNFKDLLDEVREGVEIKEALSFLDKVL